jgi:hypothetical protein
MINSRRAIALILLVVMVAQLTPPANACGPSYLEPIFVFRGSPDLPFEDFTNGNIGIVLPTFGRKTLVIAYRYLNGGSFSADEQKELVKALRGAPPDGREDRPLKDWIAARKEFVSKDEPTPEIYVERQYGGYDFFPNCASNAFEVATKTLRDRAALHGSDSKDVRDWLAAQDTVFKNCVKGSHLPVEAGRERPEWLRKDRDYQTAAALFYSLRLDEARAHFAAIAADIDSPWQKTAEYLVGRTLVRQASLSRDELRKRQLYEEAEMYLYGLISKAGNFSLPSRRLLGLVKYRLRPEERVRELARALTFENGNTNVRQDLIDYVWLLDKFESEVIKEEEARKKESDINEDEPDDNERREVLEAVQKGELIQIFWAPKSELYERAHVIHFKPDVSEAVVILMFEARLGRQLTPDEAKELTELHKSALLYREQLMRPNSQLHINDHQGVEPGKLNRTLAPEFLTADDLSDWIFSVQAEDAGAYDHAYTKWRESGSHAWLIAALMKANRSSTGLDRLMRAAQRVDRDLPAFAGSFYHLVRLKLETGKKAEAREMLDAVTQTGLTHLPVSTQNLFAEQRMLLAQDLAAFLRAGLRTPVAFYDDGRLVSRAKFFEPPETSGENSDEHRFQLPQEFEDVLDEDLRNELRRVAEAESQRLMAWKDRALLDSKTTEVVNTHFSLPVLIEVSRGSALPDYLRQRIALAVWTRAIVLQKPAVADKVVPDLVNLSPEMKSLLTPYLNSKTAQEKERAALFILLKNTDLSPLIAEGLPPSPPADDYSKYYYESAWWCPPSLTEYTMEGDQVAKHVPVPPFMASAQVAEAKRDQARLIEIGDAKSYLGKRVLEWAKAAPGDQRIPEALFIASRANAQYKYGCDSWNHDNNTKQQAERLLRTRYPNSAWAEKLNDAKR